MPTPPEIPLAIDNAVRPLVRLGVVAADGVCVAPSTTELLDEIERCGTAHRARHEGRAPAQIEELRAARELYRSFGIDPTKTRPSSEALLRRALKNKPLPRVFNAVDVCNLLSLEFLLPIGLYDAALIEPGVILRRGHPGESFAGIRKPEVHLEGRPVLADRRGPFGNPTSDSARTCVTEATGSLWMVIFAPPALAADRMAAHVERACAAMLRHLVPGSPAGAVAGSVA